MKKNNSDATITWVEPRLMHITLHFIGKHDEHGLQAIKRALGQRSSVNRKIQLSLKALQFFPSIHNPRVIALAVGNPDGSLIALQQEIGRLLQICNSIADEKLFQPHITLGRLKACVKINALASVVTPVTWEMATYELMNSTLTLTRSCYTIAQVFAI